MKRVNFFCAALIKFSAEWAFVRSTAFDIQSRTVIRRPWGPRSINLLIQKSRFAMNDAVYALFCFHTKVEPWPVSTVQGVVVVYQRPKKSTPKTPKFSQYVPKIESDVVDCMSKISCRQNK